MKIITDSTSDLSLNEAKRLGIELVPLKVSFGQEEFEDKVTISNEQFYEKLKSSKDMPITSQVNPDQFISIFNNYDKEDIVGVFISSKLSGTYQSAVIAKNELERSNIYLVDSTSTTIALELLLRVAVTMRDQGKDAAVIFEKLEELKTRLEILAVVDTLKYLVKGGRLNYTAGVIGEVMGIKPIIGVADGVISQKDKVRGMKNAIERLFEILSTHELDLDMPIVFGHSDSEKDILKFKDRFNQIYTVKEQYVTCLGSVVGAHAGPGAVALAFINKKK